MGSSLTGRNRVYSMVSVLFDGDPEKPRNREKKRKNKEIFLYPNINRLILTVYGLVNDI